MWLARHQGVPSRRQLRTQRGRSRPDRGYALGGEHSMSETVVTAEEAWLGAEAARPVRP